MTIYDARSYTAAQGNRVRKGGTEDSSSYTNCEIKFCGIPNIHSVRDLYNDLFTSCLEQTDPKVDSHLEVLEKILSYSDEVAQTVLSGKSVLVHCSDGWDRTSQLCATA